MQICTGIPYMPQVLYDYHFDKSPSSKMHEYRLIPPWSMWSMIVYLLILNRVVLVALYPEPHSSRDNDNLLLSQDQGVYTLHTVRKEPWHLMHEMFLKHMLLYLPCFQTTGPKTMIQKTISSLEYILHASFRHSTESPKS